MNAYSTQAESLPEVPESGLHLDSLFEKSISGFSTQKVSADHELASLEEDWNRLSDSATIPNVFTTFDWFRAWNRRLTHEDTTASRQPYVIVLKKDGAIAGLSPLIIRSASRFGLSIRKLEFVGKQSDYNDLVLGDDSAAQLGAVAKFLAHTDNQWDVVELRDLRETGNTRNRVETALARVGLVYRLSPENERCSYLPIYAPWSEMLRKYSPSSRHVLRNQQSRLNRLGAEGLRIRIVENPLDEPGLLEKLMAVESRKHVHGEPSEPFVGKYSEVFRALFETLGPRGWIYVALMEVGDRAIAWRFGFRSGQKLWGFLTAFDHTFSRLSPGTMLVPALVDYGFSHGYNEYDFLRGEEAYKKRWTTHFRQNYRLLIWSRRWISRVRAYVYLDLKPIIYRLLGEGE